MTQTFTATRRTVLAAASASAAAPALLAFPAMAQNTTLKPVVTEIAALWSRAAALTQQMQPFSRQIVAMQARAGLPGWMHLSNEANSLGHQRYDTLVAILKAKPQSLDDLVIVAQTTREPEIASGPITWARFQFDRAARDYHLAA